MFCYYYVLSSASANSPSPPAVAHARAPSVFAMSGAGLHCICSVCSCMRLMNIVQSRGDLALYGWCIACQIKWPELLNSLVPLLAKLATRCQSPIHLSTYTTSLHVTHCIFFKLHHHPSVHLQALTGVSVCLLITPLYHVNLSAGSDVCCFNKHFDVSCLTELTLWFSCITHTSIKIRTVWSWLGLLEST